MDDSDPSGLDLGNLLTAPEVAKRCRVNPATVYRWLRGIRIGDTKVALPCLVVGQSFRFKADDLSEFLAACKLARLGPLEPPPLPPSPAKRKRDGEKARERADRVFNPWEYETPRRKPPGAGR